jgi:hypothetical protein
VPLKELKEHHQRNLVTAELPAIFLDEVHDEDIRSLYHAALDKAHQAVRWYVQGVRAKRGNAKVVRIGTVVLGAIAAIIPIVTPMMQKLGGQESNAGINILPFATISAALAGGLLAMDRYFGFSTGYMRYTGARQEIQAKIERFQMAWARTTIQHSASATPVPKAEALNAGLALIQELVDGVAQTVQTETQSWMAEFKQSLSDLDKSVQESRQSAPAANAPGALKVTIDGWDLLSEPRTATIQINQRAEENLSSPTYVVGSLAPGQYVIKVTGSRAGLPISGAEIVMLKAGEITAAQVKLG